MVNNLLYEGAPENILCELETSHMKDTCLSFKVYSDAFMLPFRRLENGKSGGGIVTDKGQYLQSSGVHYNLQTGYDFKPEKAVKNEDTVIYLGMFYEVWGHCLTDNLRRLWFLRTDEYKEHFINCRLVYLTTDSFKMSSGFSKILEILGINVEQLCEIKELSSFKKIVVPDESFFLGTDNVRYFTKEYVETIDKLREYGLEKGKDISCSELEKYRKVFLSYSQFRREMSFGEDILKDYFERAGYTVIAPENYSFEEQLVIFANCEKLASTIGSCAHNCIFMKDGSEVILIPRSYYITGYQEALNDVHNLNITYVDSSLSNMVQPDCPWGGPFCFCISKELKDILPENNPIGSNAESEIKKTLKSYYRYSEKMEAKFKPSERVCPPYYDKAVREAVDCMEKSMHYGRISVFFKRIKFRILYRTYYLLKRMNIIKE